MICNELVSEKSYNFQGFRNAWNILLNTNPTRNQRDMDRSNILHSFRHYTLVRKANEMRKKMKTIATMLGIAITGGALSACSFFSSQTYCLEEQEANGLDYMVAAPMDVCENPDSDSEYYDSSESFNYGDIVYVEADGNHSVKNKRKSTEIKKVQTPPPYVPAPPRPVVPAPTKICLKAYNAPAPPAPKPPAPAPVAPKPVPVAPKPQPAPVVPKAPVAPAPTNKPGC